MDTYTIYYDTKDHPGVFCARRFVIEKGKSSPDRFLGTAANIEGARALVERAAPGRYRIPRSEKDDPVIMETWI